MQLFYGGVPHDVVTCEANIHYQYFSIIFTNIK